MRLNLNYFFLSLISFSLLLNPGSLLCQESGISEYQFYSPRPNSTGINPETEIVIRYGKAIDLNSLGNNWLQVTGENSGKHKGNFRISHDQLTLVFKPDQCFLPGENINLFFSEGVRTRTGELLPSFRYTFRIRQKPYDSLKYSYTDSIKMQQVSMTDPGSINIGKGTPISFSDIPDPVIYYSNGAAPGNIMAVLEKQPNDYLYLFNNNGSLLAARKISHRISNFKPHLSGIATYFDHVVKGHIKIDSLLNNIDTLFMKNGYKPDAHDILLLDNGHVIMESYDPQLVDMSKVTEGGAPDATVIGLVIQELDENMNLIFEWRSWDHFKITDTYNNLLSSVIEYVHGNSLDADTDSTLIISSRNLNEITKISRLTGKIIWRLGGKNNQFTFNNDPRGFSAQHSAMKQKNGNLTIFDNGNGFEPIYSRGIEYNIDELNKKVTLINEYRHDPDVFAYVTGNLQRLENGNTFIFWGTIVGQTGHTITEFDPSGKVTFEVRFDLFTYPTYASYRTKWDHSLFRLSTDSVKFAEVIQGDSVTRDISVINQTNKRVTITSVYGHDRGFKIKDLPLSIAALSTETLRVEFHPRSLSSFSDILTICQETDSSIIARPLVVMGKSKAKTGITRETISDLEIYPNPVMEILEIKSLKLINQLLIYDLSGRIIRTISPVSNSFTVNMQLVDKGFYLVAVVFSDKTRTVKRIVKQ